MQRLGRMKHELSILKTSTMTGISAWNVDDDLFHLQAQIVGGDESPYKGGVFKLEIRVPDRYPFEPPHVKFLTPIYHPNIDAGGRICLDVLKMPPKGNWKPSSNISTVLLSIQLLMNEPNPDDPLMEDISQQYKSDRRLFRETAARWTQRHAVETKASPKTTTTTTANDDGVEVSTGKVAGRVTPVEGKSSNDRAKAGNKTEEGKRDEGKISAASTTGSVTNSGRDEASLKTSNTSNDLKENRHPIERKNPATTSKSNVKSTSKSSDVDKHSASASSSVKRDSDDFDDMFDDDEDDDFIAKTPHKKTKATTSKMTSAVESDSFSDMNDSDLDLFDFDESPVKKKKKMTE